MSGHMLEVQGLCSGYGAGQVLFDLSLSIVPGQCLGLLGRNGMGKSTLVKTIAGQVRTLRGTVSLDGVRIDALPMEQRARLGLAVVPEGRQIFPNLSVAEHLRAFARTGKAATQWTPQTLYAMFPRLEERRANMGWQLSGGEQQMLAIARALSTNPALLILDEATEGLAPLIREEIWAALDRLADSGISLIVIDKYAGKIAALAEESIVLERGRISWQGKSASLVAQPELMKKLIGV
jgi:branched-chain amino acid transport system ATP-binding protein